MSDRELESLFRKRLRLIDAQQSRLARKIKGLERIILQKLLESFLEELRVEKGIIKSARQEIKLSEALDRIFDAFERNDVTSLARQISNDLKATFNLNIDYYKGMFESDSKGSRFNEITRQVNLTMRKRLGIETANKLVPDGYLDRLIKNVPLRNEVKKLTYKAVTGGMAMKQFTQSLTATIVGNKNVDGSLSKYYKQFVYDTYLQFDRSTNDQFAKRLDLDDFIYAGGLIDDSREFCIDKNGKVFTIEDTKKWINDPKLLKTKQEKETGVVTDYIPTVDMGRWKCRHIPRYISPLVAKSLRK